MSIIVHAIITGTLSGGTAYLALVGSKPAPLAIAIGATVCSVIIALRAPIAEK